MIACQDLDDPLAGYKTVGGVIARRSGHGREGTKGQDGQRLEGNHCASRSLKSLHWAWEVSKASCGALFMLGDSTPFSPCAGDGPPSASAAGFTAHIRDILSKQHRWNMRRPASVES